MRDTMGLTSNNRWGGIARLPAVGGATHHIAHVRHRHIVSNDHPPSALKGDSQNATMPQPCTEAFSSRRSDDGVTILFRLGGPLRRFR